MRNIIIGLLLCSAIHAECAEVTISKTENTATIDMATSGTCQPTFIEHFSRQSLYNTYSNQQPSYALISQEFELGTGCFESYNPASVTVTSRPIEVSTGKIGGSQNWSFTTQGIIGAVEEGTLWGLYRVEMPGCCSSSKTTRYFSLDTGKLLISSTGPLLDISFSKQVESGRQVSRYVGVEDNTASLRNANTKSIATIYFSDRKSMKEAVDVYGEGKLGKEDWSLAEIGFKGKDAGTNSLMTSETTNFPVHVVLHCRCDAPPLVIDLPYTADGLDIESATISGVHGITLQKSHP